MFTNKQKIKFVEDGLKEFSINPKFRDMLKWFVESMDKTYDELREKEWKEFWDNIENPPPIKPKSTRKMKFRITAKS